MELGLEGLRLKANIFLLVLKRKSFQQLFYVLTELDIHQFQEHFLLLDEFRTAEIFKMTFGHWVVYSTIEVFTFKTVEILRLKS